MSFELRRGLMGNKTPIKAVEVTGGSINTSWIPLEGAIVIWEMRMLPNEGNEGFDIKKNNFFQTYPYQDKDYNTFACNSGRNITQLAQTFNWIYKAYQHGGVIKNGYMPWINGSKSIKYTWYWDSFKGYTGFLEDIAATNKIWEIQKKTTTSGYPLQLFCGRTLSRVIIYKVELINQEEAINAAVGTTDSSGNLITREKCINMTLIPTISKGVVGFKVKETGEFLSSDNGVPFTKYE